MRIAVLSDIHGNPFALQAALRKSARQRPLDALVAAGDLCFAGSGPARCVDLLQQAGALALRGNTDEYLTHPDRPPSDAQHSKKWAAILADVHWARSRLGPERLAWLAALPFARRFSPTSRPEDDLLVVHAHPKSLEGAILPSPADQLALTGRVTQPDDDPELAWMMDGVQPRTLAFGHLHFTNLREWRGYRLVNVAPCNLPTYDHDPRARFTLFTWTGQTWDIARHYAPYDYTQELDALARSGMPGWQTHAATFPSP